MARVLAVGVAFFIALLATALAFAIEDAQSPERDLEFPVAGQPLAAQGPVEVPPAGAELLWQAPANATGANVTVTVSFSGQAVQGGNAIATAELVAPDGRVVGRATQAVPVGAGATAASQAFEVSGTWADPPRGHRGERGSVDGVEWDGPILLRVRVEAPGDIPGSSYAFQVEAEGTANAWYVDEA